jgi:hypothetical protein
MAYSAEVVARARARLAQDREDRASENRRHLAHAYETVPRLRQIDIQLRATMALAAQAAFTQGEDPQELLQELERDYGTLENLIARINHTNNETKLPNGKSLTELLARRDCLTGKLEILRQFLDSASARVQRHSVGEIKIVSTVHVRDMQKQVDQLSAELRQLDETIQEKNWTTELL